MIVKKLSTSIAQHLKDLAPKVQLPLAETPLQQLAFDPQHFGAISRQKYVGMTPYGLCEARYLMKGGYVAAGVPRAKVPGATLQSQIEHIFTADGSKEFVKEASEGDGFFCQHDEDGTVLTLPQGHIIAVAGWAQPEADKEAGSFGIRWSFFFSLPVSSSCSLLPKRLRTW